MKFQVTLSHEPNDPQPTVHVIDVINPDRLRAEQMGTQIPGLGDLSKIPLTLTTLWCWAACKRLGLTDVKAVVFLNDVCLDVEKAPGEPGEAPDPTQPGPPTETP